MSDLSDSELSDTRRDDAEPGDCDLKDIAHASFRLIETGDGALAERIVAAGFVNHEAEDDPEDADRQLRGPAGFLATAEWLRNAFSELHFEHEETLADEHTVLAVTTMTGRHTGAFNGIPPTNKTIRHRQAHIFTIADGRIIHHRAIRDDLGLLRQLGARLG